MKSTILITGANRGIGLALLRELLARGDIVIAACRNPAASKELQELEVRHPGVLTVVKLDVDSDYSVDFAARHEIFAKIGALDVIINNAAVFPEEGHESIEEINLAHFRVAFETNVMGVIHVTRTFLPLLEKGNNPRIVNISSGAGSISDKKDFAYYAYSTSKAALNMVTRAMAEELRRRKITVVAISPGWVKTEMGGPDAPLTPEESARSLAKTIAGLSLKDTSSFLNRDGAANEYGW